MDTFRKFSGDIFGVQETRAKRDLAPESSPFQLHVMLQDFPFLRQHKPAKGTITMENGDMAAVCLDCFETLKNQFVEQVRH